MKDIFKRLIIDFQERNITGIIEREINIPLNIHKIISLIGVRRCGKTSILYSIIQKLRRDNIPSNIVYINFEDDRIFPLKLKDLNTLIEAYYELFPDKKNEIVYFFFDEIQNIENWEKFIRRIYDNEKCRIFITGSSSKLLSKEIATSLRGRTITFEIFPLSFREFLLFRKIQPFIHSSKVLAKIKNAFNDYIFWGGFPEITNIKDQFLFEKIIQNYMDLIMYKDIADRFNIGNLYLLKILIKYCFTNISTLLSINKLYNDLKSQGISLSKNTLYEYLSYLEDAFAIFSMPMYTHSLKEQNRNPKKIYSIDWSFKRIVSYIHLPDYSKIFENIAFLHLKRKIKDIYYYKLKQEIDFFIEVNGNKKLINVSYDISSAPTKNREIKGLITGMEETSVQEALLITNDCEEEIKINNKKIQILPLWKWLLDS